MLGVKYIFLCYSSVIVLTAPNRYASHAMSLQEALRITALKKRLVARTFFSRNSLKMLSI